tara:strand:- start:1182 stop:1688 length:507 start_codon:yes stop_codon:yes gene_type:complete
MADTPQVMIDAPIAGQSLTAELGNRPWQKPPQYNTVEEALDYYIPRLTDVEMQDDLMNVIELGIPLTTIADTLQSGGAMDGKHTIDVGLLIIPVLIETLAYLAEEQEVEYTMGTEMDTSDTPSSAAVALAIKKIKEKSGEPEDVEEPEPEVEVELEEPSGGLMSRRTV